MDMKSWNISLAILGIAALIAYCIACRASFSPDGKKVLFPVFDPEIRESSVMLYDRETGKTEKVFSISRPEGGGKKEMKPPEDAISSQWIAGGKRALVLWPEEKGRDHLMAAILPLGTGDPTRIFVLPEQSDPVLSLIFPPPVIGDRLFIGGKSIFRLDLKTGEVKAGTGGEEIYLLGQGDRIYYMKERTGSPEGCEIGTVVQENLSLAPLLVLEKEKIGEAGFFAVSGDGRRIALVARKDKVESVLVLSGKESERTIALGTEGEAGKHGNILWSPDGKTIYAAFAKDLDERGNRLGFKEIYLSGDRPREVPLLSVEGKGDEQRFLFQISLSPDGKTVAAASTFLEPEDMRPEDRALFLVDLSSPERKVTRIAVPLSAGGRPAGTKE